MKLPIYQYDAFATEVFKGNPAAIVPLTQWLDDATLQAIAQENNLSETAFIVPIDQEYEIRWLTPQVEVDLCGHATLASAAYLFEYQEQDSDEIVFHSRSGELRVKRVGEEYQLDFPTNPVEAIEPMIIPGIEAVPQECYQGIDHVFIFNNQKEIEEIQPNFTELATLEGRGVIVTAPASSEGEDFVYRFFAPRYGINEDPVTGSAITKIAAIWSKKLNQTKMNAKQISQRTGSLGVEYLGDRVLIQGAAKKYLEGCIWI